jgi:alanine racemase
MNTLQWLEINLNNFKHNVCSLKSLISKKTKFMAVVKSNAYGHGIIECSKAAVKAGANWLGVVNLGEAIRLRKSEVTTQIMVLGYVKPDDFIKAAEKDISIAVVNWEQLKQLLDGQIVKLLKNKKLKIHLKIETGISRLGFTEEEWPKLISEIKKLHSNIIVEGIYSHFASVEEYDLAYAKKQIEKFTKFKKMFKSSCNLKHGPIFHMAASAAMMVLKESHFDMVRCGIAIYGLWPSKKIKNLKFKIKNFNNDFLKPVLSYKTKIVQVKQIKRGDYIGYGCTYPVDAPMLIAIIPIGYAEGFDRGFSNPSPAGNKNGEVLVNGTKCPVVGRVCMNMAAIDVSRLISNTIADRKTSISQLYNAEVVLLGKQGNYEICADEWAEKLGTINYEITTSFPEQIKRIYSSN